MKISTYLKPLSILTAFTSQTTHQNKLQISPSLWDGGIDPTTNQQVNFFQECPGIDAYDDKSCFPWKSGSHLGIFLLPEHHVSLHGDREELNRASNNEINRFYSFLSSNENKEKFDAECSLNPFETERNVYTKKQDGRVILGAYCFQEPKESFALYNKIEMSSSFLSEIALTVIPLCALGLFIYVRDYYNRTQHPVSSLLTQPLSHRTQHSVSSSLTQPLLDSSHNSAAV